MVLPSLSAGTSVTVKGAPGPSPEDGATVTTGGFTIGSDFAFDPQAAQIANVAAANRGASLFRSNTVSIRWRRRHCTYPVGFACDKPGAFEEDTIGKTFSTH